METSQEPTKGPAPSRSSPASSEASAQAEQTAACGGRAESGAGSHSPEITALRDRVAALEAEHARLLAGYAANMESEIARLRSFTPQSISAEASELRRKPLAPPTSGVLSSQLKTILQTWKDSLRLAMM
jgi:hypothetical protein